MVGFVDPDNRFDMVLLRRGLNQATNGADGKPIAPNDLADVSLFEVKNVDVPLGLFPMGNAC